MKFWVFMYAFLLCSCGKASDDIRLHQAFEVYTIGNYSFSQTCPGEGFIDGTLSISKEIIRINHMVCDISKLTFSSNPIGPKLTLSNCRSGAGKEQNTSIIIEAKDNNLSILHNWKDTPMSIYSCPKN